jgi:hypothetical protein
MSPTGRGDGTDLHDSLFVLSVRPDEFVYEVRDTAHGSCRQTARVVKLWSHDVGVIIQQHGPCSVRKAETDMRSLVGEYGQLHRIEQTRRWSIDERVYPPVMIVALHKLGGHCLRGIHGIACKLQLLIVPLLA